MKFKDFNTHFLFKKKKKKFVLGHHSLKGFTRKKTNFSYFGCMEWQDCYPERLGKLFFVHVPYVFMAAWKVVYPFIDSKTKKKVKCSTSSFSRPACIFMHLFYIYRA